MEKKKLLMVVNPVAGRMKISNSFLAVENPFPKADILSTSE